MKALIPVFLMLALMTGSGCWLDNTKDSPQGGVVPREEEFSITVPFPPTTVKQGADTTVAITLNRGADFKRDVMLEIKAEGIGVTPTNVLIRSEDKAELQLLIWVSKDVALGAYRIAVKGTPQTGKSTSTEFTVEVVAE